MLRASAKTSLLGVALREHHEPVEDIAQGGTEDETDDICRDVIRQRRGKSHEVVRNAKA